MSRVFLDDLRWWVETGRKLALRVLDLVDVVLRDPFVGIGEPEPLRSLARSGQDAIRHTADEQLGQHPADGLSLEAMSPRGPG